MGIETLRLIQANAKDFLETKSLETVEGLEFAGLCGRLSYDNKGDIDWEAWNLIQDLIQEDLAGRVFFPELHVATPKRLEVAQKILDHVTNLIAKETSE